jgi:hypothetical protein
MKHLCLIIFCQKKITSTSVFTCSQKGKIETLLFQTGYLTILTIKKVRTLFNRRIYQLGYPNLEVRSALNEHLFEYLLTQSSIKRNTLFASIINQDMEQFERAIRQLFAAIPYNNYVKNNIQTYEGFYASVMYSYLAGLGIPLLQRMSLAKDALMSRLRHQE